MSIILSFGKFSGFYIHHKPAGFFFRYSFRICLGWVALTFMPVDFYELVLADLKISLATRAVEELKKMEW